MMRSLTTMTLALSLLFNVFFLSGYLKARNALTRPSALSAENVNLRITENLNLDEHQATAYAQLHDSFRQDIALFDESIRAVRGNMTEQLRRDHPDFDLLQQLVKQEAGLQQERRLAGSHRFNHFVELLSPEQCRQLVDVMDRQRRGGSLIHDSRESIIARFDTNKDGHLDELERQQAETAIKQDRLDRKSERENLRARFDQDGDGILDQEERKSMGEFLRQKYGRHGDGLHPGTERREGGRRDRDVERPAPPHRRQAPRPENDSPPPSDG